MTDFPQFWPRNQTYHFERKEIDGKDKGKGMKEEEEKSNSILVKLEETFRVILNTLSEQRPTS